MKKKTKILIVIASVWTLIVVIDLISIYIFGEPLLGISSYGGEVTTHIGLGYEINEIYPLVAEGEISYYCDYSFWQYAIGVAILIILIIYDVVKMRKSKCKK